MQVTLQNYKCRNQDKKKKSAPWWADILAIMRERINALRRLYQRTINKGKLRESRKHSCFEEKKIYQFEIKKKDKLNSWKKYCNVTSSSNPWLQVYKLCNRKSMNQ
jgi:hypothetical protein